MQAKHSRPAPNEGPLIDASIGMEQRLVVISRLLVGVALVAALLPTLGWILNLPLLFQLQPDWPEMVPETIAMVFISSFVLLIKPEGTVSGRFGNCFKLSHWLAVGTAMIISFATIALYAVSWGSEPAFPDWIWPKPSSPRSSISFFTLACIFAFSCARTQKFYDLSLYLLLIPFSTAMLSVVGYVSTFAPLYSYDAELGLGMSVPTAVAIVALCLSTFLGPLRHCHRGILFSDGVGGSVITTLVPIVIFLPPAVCLLILSVARSHALSQPIVVALLTLVPSLMLGIFVYYTAVRLETLKERKEQLEIETRQVSMSLGEFRESRREGSFGKNADQSGHTDYAIESMSHNLRTPLAVIKHWVDLLEQGGLDRQRTTSAFAELHDNIAHMDARLVELFGGNKAPSSTTGSPPKDRSKKRDAPEASSPLLGKRVLLVDDEESILEALQLILQIHGAEVSTAANTTAAREQLRQRNPDIVICDIGLPDEDGISFMKDIRAQRVTYPQPPAIAVTGFTAAKYQQLATDAGFASKSSLAREARMKRGESDNNSPERVQAPQPRTTKPPAPEQHPPQRCSARLVIESCLW